jgi:hypothetical protein
MTACAVPPMRRESPPRTTRSARAERGAWMSWQSSWAKPKAAPQTETYGRDSPGARTITNLRRPTRARRIARRPACPDDLAASASGPTAPRRPRSRCRTQTTQSTSAGTSTHVSRTTRSRLDQGRPTAGCCRDLFTRCCRCVYPPRLTRDSEPIRAPGHAYRAILHRTTDSQLRVAGG